MFENKMFEICNLKKMIEKVKFKFKWQFYITYQAKINTN